MRPSATRSGPSTWPHPWPNFKSFDRRQSGSTSWEKLDSLHSPSKFLTFNNFFLLVGIFFVHFKLKTIYWRLISALITSVSVTMTSLRLWRARSPRTRWTSRSSGRTLSIVDLSSEAGSASPSPHWPMNESASSSMWQPSIAGQYS